MQIRHCKWCAIFARFSSICLDLKTLNAFYTWAAAAHYIKKKDSFYILTTSNRSVILYFTLKWFWGDEIQILKWQYGLWINYSLFPQWITLLKLCYFKNYVKCFFFSHEVDNIGDSWRVNRQSIVHRLLKSAIKYFEVNAISVYFML